MGLLSLKRRAPAAVPTPPAGYANVFVDDGSNLPAMRTDDGVLRDLKGPIGNTGPSGTLAVGTVTTGAAGSSVVITNVGTAQAAILDITIPRGNTGIQGVAGDKGWSPIIAVVTDGARRVLQITDWTGGAGVKPSTSNQFIGPTGIVATAAAAVDVRGATGAQGPGIASDFDAKGDLLVGTGVDTYARRAVGANGMSLIADSAQVSGMRWARAGMGYVNAVTEFGADPTGVADSTSAINSAMGALGTGGTCFLPAGRYKIGSSGTGLVIPSSHVRLQGEGRADTVIFTDSATAVMVEWTQWSWYSGVVDIGFDNHNFAGGARVTRAAGAWVLKMHLTAPYAYALNCDFQWHRDNIYCPTHLAELHSLNVREFAQYGGVGVHFEGGPNANDKFMSNVTMASSKPYAAGSACIRIKQVASVRLVNMNCVGGEQVLDLFPDAGQVIPSVYAINSFFDQGSLACLRIRGAGTTQRSKFTQCWFSGAGDGTTTYGALLDSPNLQGADFVNCDFYGSGTGFHAQPNGANDCDWAMADSRVSGNTVVGIRTNPGAGHRFSIATNRIGNSGGFGVNAKGVEILAGAYASYQVIGNRGLEVNTAPGIFDLGTTTLANNKSIKDNLGDLIQGGAASLVAATTFTNVEKIILQALLPANGLSVGTVIRLKGFASMGATLATVTWRVRVGNVGTIAGDTLVAVTLAGGTSAASANASADILLTVRATGNPASIIGSGNLTYNAIGVTVAGTAPIAPNETLPLYVTLTVQASAVSATANVQQAQIEVVR